MSKELKDKKIEAKYKLDGCLPSPEDARDFDGSVACMAETPIPATYRIPYKAKVLNQGCVGSCVAHAIATAMAYGEQKSKNSAPNDYSRGFIYGNRRTTDHLGEGMYPRQALKAVNHDGDCDYTTFPWNETYPQVRTRIQADKEKYFAAAEPFKILNYFRLYKADDMKRALMNQGSVIISIPVYSKFGANTPLPEPDEKNRGYHCMCLIGWDETGWIVQNSWSSAWGNKGCLHLPYDYPMTECWGFTVSPNLPQPRKLNWLQKVGAALASWFHIAISFIKKWFRKKEDK